MRILWLIFLLFVLTVSKAVTHDSLVIKLGRFDQKKNDKKEEHEGHVIIFGQHTLKEKIFAKYKLGFDSSYCSLNYNDSDWRSFDYQNDAEKELNGKREYTLRLYYQFVPKSAYASFLIELDHIGASSVFLDGKLIAENGVPSNRVNLEECIVLSQSPISISKKDDSLHVIVIHFSNLLLKQSASTKSYPNIELNKVEDYIITEEDKKPIILFLACIGAFFLALACIHFFLYITGRDNKFNLYYFLFLAPLGLVSCILIIFPYIENPDIYIFLERFVSFMVPVALCSLTVLVYNLFKLKYNWYFYLMMVVYSCFFLFNIFRFEEGKMVTNSIMFLFGYTGLTIIAIVSVIKKRNGANYLGLGIIGFTVFLIISIILLTNDFSEVGLFFLALSLLSIPLFMSAFLSMQFATINKSLSQQLKQNAELAEKTIQQEKEKKELLENQNTLLEQQVIERTQEIVTQKQELQIKNQEITDSILYSKHIQEALLPDFKNIEEVLKNYFLLYKPKDIVSGDFYWFKKISKTECLVAIADCTGHGVPGALMSLISIEQLEKAYLKYHTPAEMLEEVNNNIRLTLKQNDLNSAKDGMDIALFKAKYGTNNDIVITYSGANRPCYRIKKEGILDEIKANKVSIGGHTPINQKFDAHEILLEKGDSVYFFTDGYADQFGSGKNKKLTTKRFKELLVTLHGKTASEQKNMLLTFFENWMLGYEQIDDVLVFGLLHH